MIRAGDLPGRWRRKLPRAARRGLRRVRRALGWRNLLVVALLLFSTAIIMGALTGPQSRATVFRTDPVLRAMGSLAEGPEVALDSLGAVPSLSVSPRFVLPLVRYSGKRVLAPLPPEPEPALAAVPAPDAAAATPPPIPPPAATRALATAAVESSVPAEPPRVAPKPRAMSEPLTTALIITPVVPRQQLPALEGTPELALVIDDLGPPEALTARAIELPRPVTLAFLPYADGLPAMTAAARARGHEIFVHLPMEPIGSPYPGPNAILVDLDPAELQHRITWAFDRVPLATGVNNHMGSRATSDPETMLTVLREVRRRGLEFVDSRTSPMSVGDGLAAQLGIPHAARDVFLDNNPTADAIQHMLAGAERLARKRGYALAIGHPYPATLAVLRQWIPKAEARGLRIVRAMDLIDKLQCRESRPIQVSACDGEDCPPPPC